jgi:hypothetical protein
MAVSSGLPWVGYGRSRQSHLSLGLDSFIDVGGYLASNDRAHKPHQALRLAEFASTDRLYHYDKRVMNLIIKFLDPQLPAQIKADSFGEKGIQLGHAIGLTGADAPH